MKQSRRQLCLLTGLVLAALSAEAATPMWTFTPAPGSHTTLNVADNVTASVTYEVHNQSKKTRTLSLLPTPGLVQTSTCRLAPRGQSGDSCIVNLKIIGRDLLPTGIHGGPALCQTDADGSANPLQCYQPSPANSLNVTKTKTLEDWNNWGQNTHNNHHNINSGLTKNNIETLVELCKIDYAPGVVGAPGGSYAISSKPVIVKDTIYWTGFAGKIGAHKILRDEHGNFSGCNSLWVQDVASLFNISSPGKTPSVRSSPAFYIREGGQGTLLYTAFDSIFSLPFPIWFSTPPFAFALDANTGNLLWNIDLVDPATVAVGGDAVAPSTTASPRIYKNTAYIGISSLNNALDPLPLTFRGHMIALHLGGQSVTRAAAPYIKWTQYTIPPRPSSYAPGTWFSGGGVWTSTPSIVPELGLVIFGAGQLYHYPDFTDACMERPETVITPNFITTKKGQTGKGAEECLRESEQKLKSMGITEPLAGNSIIALNMADGSFAWHVPTAGIDSWQSTCGLNVGPTCGPDWDVGGSAPVVADLPVHGKVIISHNKGGEMFWVKATTGELLKRVDVCVGSALGGTHWGLSYDPDSQTVYAPCSAGGIAPNFGGSTNFMSILANGRKTCMTGYLNAIDANTGRLKWQTLPANSEIVDVNTPGCPDELYNVDERFKYGLNFDLVIKNNQFNVPVNIMPDSSLIPLANQDKARSNGVPATSNGIVYWPVYYGMVYALDGGTGAFLRQAHCDEGAMYTAGPSVAKGLLMFGCGYGQFSSVDVGRMIMVYGLPSIPVAEKSA